MSQNPNGNRVLILYAHPNQRQSRVNRLMAERAASLHGITLIDLYALYPRYKIDIDAEQQRLIDHDVVVFQFPFYWYSTPALLKEWQDLVLEYGFAYGNEGNQLQGKLCLIAVTAGGSAEAYSNGGLNGFSIRSLLAPLEQTACLCKMPFLAPLVLYSSLAASDDGMSGDGRLVQHINLYQRVLESLRDGTLDVGKALQYELFDPALLTAGSVVDTHKSDT